MCAQDGGGALRGQWAEASGRDRLSFTHAWNDDAQVLGLPEDRYRQA
jgi:hypothetical protein